MIRKNEMGPEDAAAALGLTVAALLARAGEGKIAGAVLDRDGWRFKRVAIEKMLAKRAA